MPFTVSDRGADPNRKPVYMSCCNRLTHLDWQVYCGPGHTFNHWSYLPYNFQEMAKLIVESGNDDFKYNKIGWYGQIETTTDALEGHNRLKLYELGRKYNDKFDIVCPTRETYKTMPELVSDYRYLIDIGGNGYSGRLKYLLFSNRPMFIVDRYYQEYYHFKLVAYEHYIPVKMDLSDLVDRYEWALSHEEECMRIAYNAYNFALQNFTMDKVLERVYEVYCNLKNI